MKLRDVFRDLSCTRGKGVPRDGRRVAGITQAPDFQANAHADVGVDGPAMHDSFCAVLCSVGKLKHSVRKFFLLLFAVVYWFVGEVCIANYCFN